MKRPLELKRRLVSADPDHFGTQGLEAGQTDDHAFAHIDHFDQFDPAAVGRHVERRELKAETAGLAHGNLAADSHPPAAALRIRLRLADRRAGTHENREGRLWRLRSLCARSQPHPPDAVLEVAPFHTHWLTARLIPVSEAPLPSRRTSRRAPRSD